MANSETEKQYKALTLNELVELSKEGFYLSEEDRSILKNELIRRGREGDALEMDAMFEEEINLKELSEQELSELILKRLHTGESTESIKADLDEQGISIPDFFDNEHFSDEKDEMFERIALYKQRGVDQSTMNKRLKERYDLDEKDVEEIKSNMRSYANVYIGGGVLLIGISLFMAILALMHDAIFLMIGFFLAGISLLLKGLRLRR